jgi:hypothetical protein|nr:MAG TPA: hypothetical protein [Caudoviricetes sp.]
MNWQQWKAKYHRELEHIAGYEEKFVDLVLMNIPNLQPTDVIPQYHFKDSSGKNRYIDFMIISQHKNWLLPIELDGYAKMVGNGNDYERFTDFLERQNDIIKIFGKIFRFTNKEFLTKPKGVINTIISNISVTYFDFFWFNFKINDIQNNTHIPNKFIHYDFIDTVLKPFALTVNDASYFMVDDYYIIDQGSYSVHISVNDTDCCITTSQFTYVSENFYEDKDNIITTITRPLSYYIEPQKFVYQNLTRKKSIRTWRDWYKYYEIEEKHVFVEKFLKKLHNKPNLFSLKHSDDDVIIIYYQHIATNWTIALVICDDDNDKKYYKELNSNICIRFSEDEIINNATNAVSKVNETILQTIKQIRQKNRKAFMDKIMLPFRLIKSLFKFIGNILTATELVVDRAKEKTTKWVVTSLLEQIEDAKSPQEKARLQKELQEYITKENLSDEFIESCKPKKDNS